MLLDQPLQEQLLQDQQQVVAVLQDQVQGLQRRRQHAVTTSARKFALKGKAFARPSALPLTTALPRRKLSFGQRSFRMPQRRTSS